MFGNINRSSYFFVVVVVWFGSRMPIILGELYIFTMAWYFIATLFVHLQVDPQEKKKKKTGRAKRRMQYNRRFVNVVATFGRKKGPNSNTP